MYSVIWRPTTYFRIVRFVMLTLLLKILTISIVHGQNTFLVDSLEKRLEGGINDTFKIELLNELSWQLRKSEPQKSLKRANQAKKLSQETGFLSGKATALNRIGEVKKILGNYLEASEQFLNALEIERSIGNVYGVARALNQLCITNKNLGNLSKSLEYGKESLELFININNASAIALAHNTLANVYRQMGRYDKALTHLETGLKIRNQLGKPRGIAHSLTSLGRLYGFIGDHDSALEKHTEAAKIWERLSDPYEISKTYTNLGVTYYELNQLDSAINYNLWSLEIKDSLGLDFKKDSNYNNLGIIYSETGQLEKAIDSYTKSLHIKRINQDQIGIASVSNNLGIVLFKQEKLQQALKVYKEGFRFAKNSNNKIAQLELSKGISDTYSRLGRFKKSLEFNKIYLNLKDSIESIFKETVKIRRQLEKEKNRIQLLEKDDEINLAISEKKTIIIYGLVAGLIFTFLLFFYAQRAYRLKQKTILDEKNQKIDQQRIDKLLKDQELTAIAAMLEGQEIERKRIARDLHDRLGSMLSMVKIHFKVVEDKLNIAQNENLAQYEKANNLLDEACDEVRKISHDMVSGILSKFGLIPALTSLKESIKETGHLTISFFDFGFDNDRLEYDVEINLYRIVQELTSNILKHANASEMTIQLIKKDNNVNLTVEDNGNGFEINNTNSTGIGLKSVEARVDKINGELFIDSGKGSGTTVTIDVPLIAKV